MSDKQININFPALNLLGVLFVGLKLTGYIDWSWLWVLAPFWIPIGIVLGILGVMFLIGIIVALLERK